MSVQLQKIIIHEIKKDQGSNDVEEFLSEESLDIEDVTSFVADTLNQSFTRNNIYKGEFLPGAADTVFRNEFANYREEDQSNERFIHFTRRVVSNLSHRLQGVTQAKGGYLVCAEYTSNGQSFLSIFLVRDTDRVLFNRDEANNRFSVQKTENVDTDKLAMACRINMPTYDLNSPGYLQFIRNNQADVSNYFIEWINATQSTSSKDHTRQFVSIIEQLGPGYKEDGEQYTDIDQFHKDLSGYIKSIPGKLINLNDISARFYQNEDFLNEYVEQHDLTIDTEFTAHTAALRKLNRLDFKYSSLQLKFSHGDWNGEVVRIVNGQVVINSPQLVAKIEEEMDDA